MLDEDFKLFLKDNNFKRVGKSNGYYHSHGRWELWAFDNGKTYSLHVRQPILCLPCYTHEDKRLQDILALKEAYIKQLKILDNTQWK